MCNTKNELICPKNSKHLAAKSTNKAHLMSPNPPHHNSKPARMTHRQRSKMQAMRAEMTPNTMKNLLIIAPRLTTDQIKAMITMETADTVTIKTDSQGV